MSLSSISVALAAGTLTGLSLLDATPAAASGTPACTWSISGTPALATNSYNISGVALNLSCSNLGSTFTNSWQNEFNFTTGGTTYEADVAGTGTYCANYYGPGSDTFTLTDINATCVQNTGEDFSYVLYAAVAAGSTPDGTALKQISNGLRPPPYE